MQIVARTVLGFSASATSFKFQVSGGKLSLSVYKLVREECDGKRESISRACIREWTKQGLDYEGNEGLKKSGIK